jgi:membrane protease YdiL (CAAX protease family)
MPSQESLDTGLFLFVTLVLTYLTLVWLRTASRRHHLEPPGFVNPWRKMLALGVMGMVLWLSLFSPLFAPDGPPADISQVPFILLVFVQGLLIMALLAWYGLGFLPPLLPGADPRRWGWNRSFMPRVLRELGLAAENPWQEVRVGLAAGIFAWGAVLCATMVLGMVLTFFLVFFGEADLIPKAPPPIIAGIAGLPVIHRLGISLVAGVVEELFFRGFLQRRLGIAAATVFFVLAHAGYGQPMLFFSITLLSIFYGLLVKWRGNVLAAMVAHFLFDAVQLLVVIPAALKLIESQPAALVAGTGIC